MGAFWNWLIYGDDEGEDMKKKPSNGSYAVLCKLACAVETLVQQQAVAAARLKHVTNHLHHLEELIVAASGPAPDQEKLNAIFAKSEASKAKLAQALAETVPSAPAPGTPPQP